MSPVITPPLRQEVKVEDTWNLALMFKSAAAWERAFKQLQSQVSGFGQFRGKLGAGAKTLLACCEFSNAFGQQLEKVAAYAQLKHAEDITNPVSQSMVARVTHLSMIAAELSSYIAPEIQAVPKSTMSSFLKNPILEPHAFSLRKLLRYRPHVLTPNEERLLAMQGEVSETPSRVFEQLTDADLKFGEIADETGQQVEVTQSSLRRLLESPKRSVRKAAFDAFYEVLEGHKNTLAATLSGSTLQDVYYARARNYPSALEASLFDDKMPIAAYDALIEAVRDALPALHKYLALRRKALRVKEYHVYDNYVPITRSGRVNIPYDQAVDMICDAVLPLGDGYVKTMRKGLTDGRWVDRYENRNKHSGAFSYGCYGCQPYILMNYQEQVLDSVFTLAHEAGHSMHSWYSMKHQPYQYAHYPILLAEVASTFNEQLLSYHLLDQASDKKQRAMLVNKKIDEIRFTVIRQTMFAEFEKTIHAIAEAGQPLTLETLRAEYRVLLDLYFGSDTVIDASLELEGMRIPHFYRAFYVYKYATGLSAAIALSRMALDGGVRQRDRYLEFLSSGASRYPLDTLKRAGVDLSQPEPIRQAMRVFAELVDELEALI